MSQKIKVAVVGTSWWADGAHLPGLRARPDVEVVALCGRNPDRLAAIAEKFDVANTYTSYQRLLAEVAPQVVVVLVPNHLHAPFTLHAIQSGAHVICEKPLALNAAEAAQMLAAAEQRGVRHHTFFTFRGAAGARYIKQLIGQGYLGDFYHAQACYLHDSWLDPNRLTSWKTSLAEGGTGVLGDLGAHVIDLLQWWVGPMKRVSGSLSTFIGERPTPDGKRAVVETDDAAAFTAEFANGSQATVQLSRVAPTRKNYQRFELYGSAGTLIYDYEQTMAHVGRVLGARHGDAEPQPLEIPAALSDGLGGPGTFPALYRVLTDSFFANLNTTAAPVWPTFEDGLAAQKVLDAVARSATHGRWETV